MTFSCPFWTCHHPYHGESACQKKLDTIHEYLLYIMSPFIYEEDMDEFCTDLLRFAMDHNYRSEVEWKRFKTKLSSFDVRHLVWSIAIRLGLGKGKIYSNDDCACYIECRFTSLCVTASGEPLSHSTLRNLTVTSNSDKIHCDIQGADGLLFHIPSQLGVEKGWYQSFSPIQHLYLDITYWSHIRSQTLVWSWCSYALLRKILTQKQPKSQLSFIILTCSIL